MRDSSKKLYVVANERCGSSAELVHSTRDMAKLLERLSKRDLSSSQNGILVLTIAMAPRDPHGLALRKALLRAAFEYFDYSGWDLTP